ncbi:MAG: hypothetical protein KKA32_14125 [Actinobacteria bacterium]|nr:hypothetical protein [Actinomycetota bacterium]
MRRDLRTKGIRRRNVTHLLAVVAAAVALVLSPAVLPASAHDQTTLISLEAVASSSHVRVRSSTDGVAVKTLTMADRAWEELRPRFVNGPAEPVEIVVVEDEAEYERIQPAPMTRGFATFGGNRIYLRGTDLDQEVVTHEMAHILLGANVRAGLRIPDWFNEGFAQYVSGADDHTIEVLYMATSENLLGFSALDEIDALRGPDRDLATIQGFAIVRFLADRYDEEELWALVTRLSHARSFNQALLDTYDRSDLELSDDWLVYATDEYGMFSLVGLQMAGTLALGALILVAVTIWLGAAIRRATRGSSPLDLTQTEIEEADRAERL